MDYMRGDWQVWSDGTNMHIEDGFCERAVTMPLETFDELVAMRWFRLSTRERAEAAKRAVGTYDHIRVHSASRKW
jgi:hypothetical protein